MLATLGWDTLGALVGVLAPLVGAPLTLITLYLKAIHQQQQSKHADAARRIDRVEQCVQRVSDAVNEFERDYTTKEEWLRESMLARQQLERLTEMIARVQADIENAHGLAAEFARAAQAMVTLADRLSRAMPPMQDSTEEHSQ